MRKPARQRFALCGPHQSIISWAKPTVFRRFPQLNVSEVARSIGINKSLLSRYIYGIKKPSESRKEQILDSIRQLGWEMAAI